jgi:glutamate-1-semialdehyde aminotransferase
MVSREVPQHLHRVGTRLFTGLTALQRKFPELVAGVGGMPEMCFLQYGDETVSRTVTTACAQSGILFKRSAYNFVSLAHEDSVIDRTLNQLREALSTVVKPA